MLRGPAAHRTTKNVTARMRGLGIGLLSLAALAVLTPTLVGQDTLQQLREDVRSAAERGPSPPSPPPTRQPCQENYAPDESDPGITLEMLTAGAYLTAFTVTSPFWVPHSLLGDDFSVPGAFSRFPYEDEQGYMVLGTRGESCPANWRCIFGDCFNTGPSPPRSWAGRLQCDWGADLGNVERTSSHLLLSTMSRVEFDAQADYFRETMSGNRYDDLWMGDCNLVYRFAQSANAQFRAGLGFNWLADDVDADFGFNSTYQFDVFPYPPWVLSTELDWGTLGSAELFRFRSTVGVTVHGFEVYMGYEYLDIDRLHDNAVLSGVRLWF